MSVATVRRLLRERLLLGCDDAGVAPTRRAFEGAEFVAPSPAAVWVRETLIPGAESVVAVGRGPAAAESRGVYQVDVYAPANRGTADLDAAVEAIRARFAPGALPLAADGVWLELLGASPLAISDDGRELHCPLSITWRARRAL